MSGRSSQASGSVVVEGLDAHLAQFVGTLARASYLERTRFDKRLFIAPFIRWARDAPFFIARIDERNVCALLARPLRRHSKHGNSDRGTLIRFLEYVRTVRVTPPCRSSKSLTGEVLVHGYRKHQLPLSVQPQESAANSSRSGAFLTVFSRFSHDTRT
jgi:hypothetical protein